jgi:DNA repair exonuclease SbcCD nuclease subunit
MLDRKGLIEADCLNSLFKYFSSSNLKHNIIVGNHDLLSVHSSTTALEPLKALPNVNLYDKPGQIGNVLIMPYYRNPKKFLEDLNTWIPRLPKTPILLCHQGIKEFTIGSGYTEEEAIELKDVADLGLVIAGHYHTPKQMSNVIYLGSPFSHSFGESNEEKRLGVLDTKSSTIEYIPTLFRRHMTYELNLDENFHPVACDPNNINRIIVKGSEEKVESFKKMPRNNDGTKYIYITTDNKRVEISETLTNQQKWIKWAKEIKQLDDLHLNAGLELLND